MIEWAFGEYFRTGTFPPKPADITKLIRMRREADTAALPTYNAQADWEEIQKDRKAYFASPEYQEFLKKMKTEHGM